jgi:hypothetical protein
MSKVKKMLERALGVKSNSSNVERFCKDVEAIIPDWDWNRADEYDVDKDFEFYLENCDFLFYYIPEKYIQTANNLLSLAFQAYTKGQDDAGKVIIAVLNQWDNDFANE